MRSRIVRLVLSGGLRGVLAEILVVVGFMVVAAVMAIAALWML